MLAANGVETLVQRDNGYTPTPALSHAILAYNRDRKDGWADGIGITPSHNPPRDGGFKYNPPEGGPADTNVTRWIQHRANQLLQHKNRDVRRVTGDPYRAPTHHAHDFCAPYVEALGTVLDLEAVRARGIRIGVDPLGGASVGYWEPIRERYGLNLTVTNARVDPTFAFMPLDHDGKIRMDCSSADAMAGLLRLKDDYQVAFACDPDADRHGIVTPAAGLLSPNAYLAVAIEYLLAHRTGWGTGKAVGKTIVSSSLIDRVVARARSKDRLHEVPVGFKYFAPGLFSRKLCFGGEESAGACFLRLDGSTWVTEKDGLLLGLLAAEITAIAGRDPGQLYELLAAELGRPWNRREDTPCSPEEKEGFKKLTPNSVTATTLAGEEILTKLTRAPGNNEEFGGLKVITENGWFAARPSGTENLYKLYAESFLSEAHLEEIRREARDIVRRALATG